MKKTSNITVAEWQSSAARRLALRDIRVAFTGECRNEDLLVLIIDQVFEEGMRKAQQESAMSRGRRRAMIG
ncbi:MAG: hypothetical protein U0984_07605 [Prosthecobacter sp.]|nr:hypothetical protein [Prosthecobacter sp.]